MFLYREHYFYERRFLMFKSFFKTLVLGLTSGAACAAGGWLWKNALEEKAEKAKQEIENKKNNAQPEEAKENQET
jgi:hypothetical protein